MSQLYLLLSEIIHNDHHLRYFILFLIFLILLIVIHLFIPLVIYLKILNKIVK